MLKTSRSPRAFCFGIGVVSLFVTAAVPVRGQDEKTNGKWGPVIAFPNVPIHTHVLPNGKVLFWGRRVTGPGTSLDPHETTAYLWDPATPDMSGFTKLPDQPKNKKGDKFNLFCSGHTFMPDGKLFVTAHGFVNPVIEAGFGKHMIQLLIKRMPG